MAGQGEVYLRIGEGHRVRWGRMEQASKGVPISHHHTRTVKPNFANFLRALLHTQGLFHAKF